MTDLETILRNPPDSYEEWMRMIREQVLSEVQSEKNCFVATKHKDHCPWFEKELQIIENLRATNERYREALEAWNSAVRVDVLMEGPRYMGVSGTAGARAWELTRAALTPTQEKEKGNG